MLRRGRGGILLGAMVVVIVFEGSRLLNGEKEELEQEIVDVNGASEGRQFELLLILCY